MQHIYTYNLKYLTINCFIRIEYSMKFVSTNLSQQQGFPQPSKVLLVTVHHPTPNLLTPEYFNLLAHK